MHTGPTIETARLILRPPRAEDFPAWSDFMLDEEAARYIGGVSQPAATWRGLRSMVGCWALDGFAMFSVIEKASGAWVGRLGPWSPYGWAGTEVGWGIARHAWGKGYAVEGAAAAMDWAIAHLGWTDIIHCIDPANSNSRRVAEKLGSRNRGPTKLPAPFEHAPVDAWGQTAEEWRENRKRLV
jgi:RimJ/RimL family protein N-acetyltransferase